MMKIASTFSFRNYMRNMTIASKNTYIFINRAAAYKKQFLYREQNIR